MVKLRSAVLLLVVKGHAMLKFKKNIDQSEQQEK